MRPYDVSLKLAQDLTAGLERKKPSSTPAPLWVKPRSRKTALLRRTSLQSMSYQIPTEQSIIALAFTKGKIFYTDEGFEAKAVYSTHATYRIAG